MRVREAIVGFALLSAACRPRQDTASATPTASSAARPTVHLVARLLSPSARLATLDDGTVVLDANVFVYTLGTQGPPRLVGDAAGYAPLLQRDEAAPRWADHELFSARSISGTAKRLELTMRGPVGLFVWEDRWTFAPTAPVRQAKDAPMPDMLGERDTCVLLPSADVEDTWVSCRRAGAMTREIFVRRRDGWKPVSLAGEGEHEEPAAVDRDGAVWLAAHENDTEIVRLRDGRLDRIVVPDRVGPRRASYRGAGRPVDVTNPEPEAARHIRAMAPARDGTMWILTNGPTGGALYRAGGERPASVMVIGSMIDQRAEIEATQPRKKWVGHCDTVFVPLVRGRGDTFPLEKLREPRLRQVLASARAVVVGRLGDERVAGPLFTDADDDARERRIEELVATTGQNPSALPEPTCTLPVLERTFDL